MIEVKNLTIEFEKDTPVVSDVSFSINNGEIVGLIGESGSGKSITAYSIMNLLPEGANIISGSINRGKLDISEISMVYQEPMNALNPVMRIGKQIENAVRMHIPDINKKPGRDKLKLIVLNYMEDAGLRDCEKLYRNYPHQLSGGMRQRVLIAMALACRPRLIIADEPTTALDMSVRTRIIERLRKINKKYGTAILLISHDIDVVSSICQRVIVMKDGSIVEEDSLNEVMENPKDEYTQKIVASAREKRIVGEKNETQLYSSHKGHKLEVLNINGYYDKRKNKILHNVSFEIKPGEIFGLVGESGSGKSTLAKIIAGLLRESEGSILLNGIEINGLSVRKRRKYSKDIQVVFQDPFGSLNPKMKVGRFVEEPLRIHKVCRTQEERRNKVIEMFSLMGLEAEIYDRYPHELSGGQRQRISIATALILNPGLIIADEPVSSVDLTVEAQILNLLKEIHDEFHVTFLFISHDLKLVRNLCDRIAIIKDGEIIAVGKPEELLIDN